MGLVNSAGPLEAGSAKLRLPCKWEDLAVALSLANLCYTHAWGELYVVHKSDYFASAAAGITLQCATLANVVLLSFALFPIFRLLRRKYGRFAELIVDGSVCALLSWTAYRILSRVPTLVMVLRLGITYLHNLFGPHGGFFTVILPSCALVIGIIRWPMAPLRFSRAFVLVLSPWLAINVMQTIWQLCKYSPAYTQPPRQALTPPLLLPRGTVVWVIFDELDERFVVQKRPVHVQLPEFDRFRSQALSANNALPPARETLESIPSLVTGRIVSEAVPVGTDDLQLTFKDGTRTQWSREQNIFNDASKAGFRPALAGWYHPYCRVLGASLTDCFSEYADRWLPSRQFFRYSESIGFWNTLTLQAAREFQIIPTYTRFDGVTFSELDRRFWQELRAAHLDGFLQVRQKALQFLANRELRFIYVHVPIPHPPGIFTRDGHVLSLDARTNYADNLELADRFLGEIRRTMMTAGVWDDATILVTSDHPFRAELWSKQVLWTREMAGLTAGSQLSATPFMLKLPHQEHVSATYVPSFNTVLSRNLLFAIMRGEIRSVGNAIRWLDEHRATKDRS